MVQGLPEINTEVDTCESCIIGKQHKKSFPKEVSWRESVLLELIHTDISGPMKTPSLGNQSYFLIFIDDFSRMTWVYFLKEKSEAFAIFKNPLLRSKKFAASKPFAMIEEVSKQVENLKNIAIAKAFRSNLQQGILLNKMVYLKEEIKQLLKWPEL